MKSRSQIMTFVGDVLSHAGSWDNYPVPERFWAKWLNLRVRMNCSNTKIRTWMRTVNIVIYFRAGEGKYQCYRFYGSIDYSHHTEWLLAVALLFVCRRCNHQMQTWFRNRSDRVKARARWNDRDALVRCPGGEVTGYRIKYIIRFIGT